MVPRSGTRKPQQGLVGYGFEIVSIKNVPYIVVVGGQIDIIINPAATTYFVNELYRFDMSKFPGSIPAAWIQHSHSLPVLGYTRTFVYNLLNTSCLAVFSGSPTTNFFLIDFNNNIGYDFQIIQG
jgi:hypothetical protein